MTHLFFTNNTSVHTRIVNCSKFIAILLCAFFVFINLLSNTALAQQTGVLSKVRPLGSEYQNSIKILDNRFRIDSDVKEVTLVFFRKFGSPPIVLVRPDGSKLYIENVVNNDAYDWYETDTYDMISLKKPMPGPWQAVGDILPESRVMVIAGITIHADDIPNPVFSGETIKQTAYLENEGNRVDMSPFREAISLSIDFVSTNNQQFDNFGLGSRSIARFEDDGLGYDEYAGDGSFTGEYRLDVSAGEWTPVFTVRTPLFSREQVGENIVLLPNPIKVSHVEAEYGENAHTLLVDVVRDHINISDVLIDGSVRFPDGSTERFSSTVATRKEREVSIPIKGYGGHTVNLTVFAKTKSGRDLVINAKDYVFSTKMAVQPTSEEAQKAVPAETKAPSLPPELVSLQQAQNQPEPEFPMFWAILANGILLFFGVTIVLLIANKRRNPDNHVLIKLKRLFSRKKNKQDLSQELVDEAAAST